MPGVRGVEHGSKRNVRNPFHIGLTPEEQRQVWVDINRRTQRQRDQSSGAADSRSDPWDGSTLVGGDEDSETLSEVGHRKPHGHYDSRDVYHDEGRDTQYESDEESYHTASSRQGEYVNDSNASTPSLGLDSRAADYGCSLRGTSSSEHGPRPSESNIPGYHGHGSLAGEISYANGIGSDSQFSVVQSGYHSARPFHDGNRHATQSQGYPKGRRNDGYGSDMEEHHLQRRGSRDEDEYHAWLRSTADSWRR